MLDILRKCIEEHYGDVEKASAKLAMAEIDNAEELNGKYIIYCEKPSEFIMINDFWDDIQKRFEKETDLTLYCGAAL